MLTNLSKASEAQTLTREGHRMSTERRVEVEENDDGEKRTVTKKVTEHASTSGGTDGEAKRNKQENDAKD